jgi:hypothetical protein
MLPLRSHAMPGRPYLILALTLAALAGCAAVSKGEERLLEETLESYAAVIRWGNFEEAVSFVDPETMKAHPISSVDLQRYHQVQVTAYNEQPMRHIGEHDVQQLVEVGLVNVNTQSARSIIDKQVWHFDVKEKRWWLMSGLPDITAH